MTTADAWTEIEAISEQVRRALQCPICVMLAPDMVCLCPNGHTVCHSCAMELWNRNLIFHCPVCRSPMLTDLMASSVTAVKVAEVTAMVRLACAYRQFGCNELYLVRDVTEHELVCAYKPNVWYLTSAF